jgi:hypothetical protein
LLKVPPVPGVVHASNPSTQEFIPSLGYTVRPHLK